MNIWNNNLSTAPRGKTGPWKAETFVDNRPQGSEHHTYRITPQRGVYGSMFEADALLAAAAPDLLEALKRLTAEAKLDGMDKRAGCDCWVSMAEEAIAKAEGRPDHTNTDAAISGHRLALLDGPQAANRSEDEALRGMASGGVQDECAIHPANHFILDDVGGE